MDFPDLSSLQGVLLGMTNPKRRKEDELMLHYVLAHCAHLPSPWSASSIKAWIKFHNDPLLSDRIKNMKGISMQLSFLTEFPAYFEITGDFAKLKEDLMCPHCGKRASQHRTTSTLDKSAPLACFHGPLFKEIHKYIKNQTDVTSIFTIKKILIQKYSKKRKDIAKELEGFSRRQYVEYIESFSCFILKDMKNGDFDIAIKPKYFCSCVEGERQSKEPFRSPIPNSSQCGHDDLFPYIYDVLFHDNNKTHPIPIPSKTLKDTIKVQLKHSKHNHLHRLVDTMHNQEWKKYVHERIAPFLPVTGGSGNGKMVGFCPITCSCLKNELQIKSTPQDIPPNTIEPPIITITSNTRVGPVEERVQAYVIMPANHNIPSFVKKRGQLMIGSVENAEQCHQAIQFIRGNKQVAVDCEGVDLSRTGKLCLIQIAILLSQDEKCTFIFDIILLEKEPQFKNARDSLASVLEDSTIAKIMHDSRQDCSALFHQLSISVTNILDTQIAYRTICEIKRGTSAFNPDDGKRIGLGALLIKYELPPHPNKVEVHKRMAKTGSEFWATRPIPNDLVEYMVYDVISLHPLMAKMASDLQYWSLKSVAELSCSYSRRFIEEQKSIVLPNRLHELTFSSDFQALYIEIDPEESTKQEDTEEFCLDEDTFSLTSLLPAKIKAYAIQKAAEAKRNLIEVVMDHERPVSLRFSDMDIHLKEEANIKEALKSLSQGIQSLTGSTKPIEFMSDNRLGISKLLHRISAIKSRSGDVIGLTYRVGRNVEGVSHMIQDIVAKVAGYGGAKPSSVLFLGRPGVGKTTVLREVARLLSGDQFNKRVVVVDTSNEIAGDGDTPHPCIGRARRVQISHRDEQHSTMIETVQNHNPQVIIVDEIGTIKEVEAARTISQRGVSMVGTAHGEDLHTLLKNPTLRGLIGGVQQVILSADEAKKMNAHSKVYKKTRLERAGAPTFDIVVELTERHKWRVHTRVGDIIDKLLANTNPLVETRMAAGKDKIHSMFSEERTKEDWFELLKQPSE